MKLRLLPGAQADLDEALAFYAAVGEPVAAAFLAELAVARERIVEWPHTWPPLAGGMRRCLLDRFPYSVVYRVGEGEILVVAFAHHKRRPGYWRRRPRRES